MIKFLLVIIAVILISTLIITCGCSSMKAKGIKVICNVTDPNIVTLEFYEASYDTLFVDWERQGFTGEIDGFGSVGSNRARIESEGGEIVEDVSGVFNPLR